MEETVWEEKIRCEHRFTEKCHDTFITDYVATQVTISGALQVFYCYSKERKCETSFRKNCHITYKPVVRSHIYSVLEYPKNTIKCCIVNNVLLSRLSQTLLSYAMRAWRR